MQPSHSGQVNLGQVNLGQANLGRAETVRELRQLTDLVDGLGNLLSPSTDIGTTLRAVTAAALQAIDGADASAVTLGRPGSFETVAATSDLPLRVDAIQYEVNSGPCVDAVREKTVFRSDDLARDPRWQRFAARAVPETGIRSMLSFRMFFEDGDLRAGLNVYSTQADVFDDLAEVTGLILSTRAAQVLSGAAQAKKIVNLERALATNRDIGVAMGILMTRHLVTKDQAFSVLRLASQHSHRKLGDIAADVIQTGRLELPGFGDQAH